jgi:spermidine synthase
MDKPITSKKLEIGSHMILLVSIFIVATCGLIYELVAGTAASYLLGDSVTQFSTIIGVYLFSMGIGSYVSKFFKSNLLAWFVQIEIMVGLVGGFSSLILFALFAHVEYFRLILYTLVSITGILVGLEIPLLMRILEGKFAFKDLVSKVFTFDYIGALLASIIFPIWLVPQLGLMRTSFFFGILNIGVAYWVCFKFKQEIIWAKSLFAVATMGFIGLVIAFAKADSLVSWTESGLFQEKIIYSKTTPYQRIILTAGNNQYKLFLNGNLQFNSSDEYRYHEALVHPAMEQASQKKHILVLGGGDGLAVREILKYKEVTDITLVDLDEGMTKLFTTNSMLAELNHHSLNNPKVTVINKDAFLWLKSNSQVFDIIIVDFPDPSNFSVGKLYSQTFYRYLYNSLSNSGIAVIQSTSPFVARKSFWCINNTIQSAGFNTIPYHNYVPSFGEWGYIISLKNRVFKNPEKFDSTCRFISKNVFEQMLVFPKDMDSLPTEINKLNNQVLVHYFDEDWKNYQ